MSQIYNHFTEWLTFESRALRASLRHSYELNLFDFILHILDLNTVILMRANTLCRINLPASLHASGKR